MGNRKRFDEWAKLRHHGHPSAPKRKVQIRSLPNIQRLEDHLLFSKFNRSPTQDEHDSDYAEDIASKLFGVTYDDTLFDMPERFDELNDTDPEKDRLINDEWRHEDQFHTENMTPEKIVEFMDKWNIDFRAENGEPLRCTKLICRQVEAAAKGIAGHLPDMGEIDANNLEAKLSEEAKQFKKSRQKS